MAIKNKRTIWEIEKERAVALGKSWAAEMLKEHPEPSRSGIRKGQPIGFSRKKQMAAFLSILHPLLQVQELAKLSDVSPTVLMVWRSQQGFKKVAKEEACKLFGEYIRNSIQNGVEQRKGDSELRPSFKTVSEVMEGLKPYSYSFVDFIRLLPFFNPLVAIPTMKLIEEKLRREKFSQYIVIGFEINKSLSFHKNKTTQSWAKSSINVSSIKFMIDNLIVLLLKMLEPESRKEIGDEMVKEAASAYRRLLFDAIDLLAGVDSSKNVDTRQDRGRL